MSSELPVDRVTYPPELIDDVCQLVRGPARPVLENAARQWLAEYARQRLAVPCVEAEWPSGREDLDQINKRSKERESKLPPFPWPLDHREPEFQRYCAILAAFHDEHCDRCKRAPLLSVPDDDKHAGVTLILLKESIAENRNAVRMREVFAHVAERIKGGAAGQTVTGSETPMGEGDESPSNAHSPDFRSVRWFATDYSFTANQAAVVKTLWSAWENNTPEIGGQTLLEAADASTQRMDVIFRGHPAWGTMIVPGNTKGTYRLAEPTGKSVKRSKRGAKKNSRRARK